jgi:hypothetical protein
MGLFRRKKEKPDIEFVTKAKLKQVKFNEPKKSGNCGDIFMPRLVSEQPQRQNGWILRIPFENGFGEYWTTFARPTQRQDINEIPFMSTSTWQNGRMRWDDIYLEIRDYIGEDSREKLMEWVRLDSHTITGRQGYGGPRKKTVEIEMLDPTGIVIEKWVIQGCSLNELRFHQEMDETNPTIGINLSIDRAILIT